MADWMATLESPKFGKRSVLLDGAADGNGRIAVPPSVTGGDTDRR